MIVALVFSVLLNVALIIAVANVLTKIEKYEDLITALDQQVSYVLSAMRSIDIRGSFEADDEVGLVFKGLKKLVDTLEDFLEPPDGR